MNGIRPKGRMTPAVGSFLPRLTRKAMEKYGFSAATLITDWTQIVGPELAAYTEPQRLKWPRGVEAYGEVDTEATGRPGAILHLCVDSARALDVQYGSRRILERINGYFGYRAVAELRIIQSPSKPARQSLPREVVRHKASAKSPTPAANLQSIADDSLRASLERLQRAMTND